MIYQHKNKRMHFKYLALMIHIGYLILLQTDELSTLMLMLISPVFHFLVINNSSVCGLGHCRYQTPLIRNEWECCCPVCGVNRWIRMKHCYKCDICIHKYDHHCLILDECIGEFNHKYYFLLVFSHLCNSLVFSFSFANKLRNLIFIDENGLEKASWSYYGMIFMTIIFLFSSVLTANLLYLHTFLIFKNQTTAELFNRDGAGYLKNVKPEYEMPFNKGIMNNILEVITANRNSPRIWTIQ